MKTNNNRDSMTFYRSFYDLIIELPEADQLALLHAVFNYGFYFKEPELSGLAKSAWALIRPKIEANIRKWENGNKPKSFRTIYNDPIR